MMVKTADHQHNSASIEGKLDRSGRGLMLTHQEVPRPSRTGKGFDVVEDSTPTSVYRYYDGKGVLIYVGITSRGIARNHEHNQSQPWWKYVSKQDVQHFPNRKSALIAEKSLIRRHRPPFNKQHNPDKGELAQAYIDFRAKEGKDQSPGVVMSKNRGRLRMDIRSFDGVFMQCSTYHSDIPLASRVVFALSGFNTFTIKEQGLVGYVTDWRRDGYLVELTLKGRWLKRVNGVQAIIAKSKAGYFIRTIEVLLDDEWVVTKPQRFANPFAEGDS